MAIVEYEWGTCGKHVYISRAAAKKVVKRMVGKGMGRNKPGPLEAYHCRSCKGWHVGHRNPERFPDERLAGHPGFGRASGEFICGDCGEPYRKHPHSEHLDYEDRPYLRRICDGRLVKL